VIDEQELYGLGDPRRGPDVSVRPVEEVLARGTHLRRRRRTLRTAGASALVMGLIAAGLIAVNLKSGTEETPDVRAGQDQVRTDEIAPPPPPPACANDPGEQADFYGPTPLPKADVPDELRLLPEWTPTDGRVTVAQGNDWTDPCPDTAPVPRESSLVLVSGDADGNGDADTTIRLDGPLPRPLDDRIGLSRTATELRGGPALLVQSDGIGSLLFAWTGPDGWSWMLTGMGGVDEPTLRAVAEALVLNSQPADDEAVASLDPAMVPAGFQIAWQTTGTPTPAPTSSLKWSVQVGGTISANQSGIECFLDVEPASGRSPLGDEVGITGTAAQVNGGFALWGTSVAGPGTALSWYPSPDVVATAGCVDHDHGGTLDQETIVRLAESVVPVAADDPRLPDDPRLTGQG
jgi:hypothetical protein